MMAAASRRVLMIPGNGCGGDIRPYNFYGWMEQELATAGHHCVVPEGGMPDPLRARRSIWLPYIHDVMKCDEHSVVVGHSSGAVAALRLVEECKVHGLVIVAAYDDPLGDDLEQASGYFDDPTFDWDKIISNADWILQFAGERDTLVPISVQRRVGEALKQQSSALQRRDVFRYIELKHRDHFFTPPFSELMAELLPRL
ncbi:unnamed protein product [Chrysoparadoxa australica]